MATAEEVEAEDQQLWTVEYSSKYPIVDANTDPSAAVIELDSIFAWSVRNNEVLSALSRLLSMNASRFQTCQWCYVS